MERHDIERRRFFGMLGKVAGAATVGAVVFTNGRSYSGVRLPVRSNAMPARPEPLRASAQQGGAAKGPAEATPAKGAMAGAAPPIATADVADYFGSLRAGASVGSCTVVSVHHTHLGAVPVVLATSSGERFQVDVLRRDDRGPRGIAETGSVSLFLSNGGRGSKRSDADQGRGALALAAALATREASGAAAPKLLSFKDRSKRHPNGEYKLRIG